jgi:hypothetical protein
MEVTGQFHVPAISPGESTAGIYQIWGSVSAEQMA